MNYNINIDELNVNEEKIIIPKKNYYCSNCNRKGHTFKNCNEPIISNGIIAIYIKNFNSELIPCLENYINKNLKIFNNSYNKNTLSPQYNKNISKNNSFQDFDEENNYSPIKKKKNYENIKLINDNIQFLMVQRKHSLGYLEFMRGRYNLDNINTLTHLLEQMTPKELNNVINCEFDLLWNNLWDSNNIKNKNHHKEYVQSRQKFYQIKLLNPDILTNTKPLFDFNEWGFPKGRRESYESDLVCAVREFEEETNLNEKNYTILEKCKSIRENLTGTNGIGYAHNYFLSIINTNSGLNNNLDLNNLDLNNLDFIDETNREIGQTKVLTINECLNKIRPYHKNKIKIIKNIYMIVNDFIEEYCQI